MQWGKLLLAVTMWGALLLALFVVSDRQPTRVQSPAPALNPDLPRHAHCPPSAIAPSCGAGQRLYLLLNDSAQPGSSR